MVQEVLRQFGGRLERPRTRWQRRLDEALGEPVFLTADEVGVPLDWQIKLTPAETELGFTETLITPEGEEVAFEDVFLVDGEWRTRAQMEEVPAVPEMLPEPLEIPPEVFTTPDEELIYREYLRTGGVFDVGTWRMIGAPIRPEETDIDTLLDEIRETGRTPETEALLLRLAPEVTEEDIGRFFEPVGIRVTPETETLFYDVFPQQLNVDAFLDLGRDKPEELLKMIWLEGDTEASRSLITSLWPQVTDEDIDDIFTQPTREFMPEPERPTLVPLMIDALPKVVTTDTVDEMLDFFSDKPDVLRSNLITIGRNDETELLVRELYPGITEQGIKDYFNSAARRVEREALRITETGEYGTFTAGVGGLISNFGGIFKWLGVEGIGEHLTRAGQFMQVRALPVEPAAFSWEQLFNPNSYYVQGFIQSLPSLMLLAVPAVGAYGLAGSVAAKVGLGGFKRAILTGVGGAVMSRPLESAMEAGNAYDMARAKGMTHEDAKEVANQVFLNNLKLVGLDATQIAFMFMPAPARVASNVIRRGLVKTVFVAGKLFYTGLSEGGEEILQDIYMRQALGEEIKWDEEMQLVFAIGTFAGIAMGAGGDLIVRIQNRVVGGFSPEQTAQFDESRADFVTQGFSDDVAAQKALDDMAEADATVAQNIEDVSKQVEKEFTIEQIEVEDAINQAVVDNLKQKLAQEGEIVIEPVEVAPEVTRFLATPDDQIVRPTVEVFDALRALGFSEDFLSKMSVREMKQALRTLTTVPEVVPEVFTVEEYATEKGIGIAEASRQLADRAIRGEVESLGGVRYRELPTAPAVIVHKGTEPEGIAIADDIGVRYEGIKEGIVPTTMMFTDVRETGSTFTATTLEEARTKLASMREAFEEVPAVEEVAPEAVGQIPPDVDTQQIQQDAFEDAASTEDMVQAGEDAFNAQAEAAGLPPPNIPPGATGHIGSGGNNSENALYDMTNSIIPGEDAGRAALRVWDGTRNRMATETIAWWRKGSETLRNLGIGTKDGINQRLTREDSLDLFKALHGEGAVPANLQSVYDELKAKLDQEASDMLAFDPTFSRVLMAHPDYFPRGWRPPREGARLRLGAKPGFMKPRVDATFTEMIEAGWEPISWNPYDMVALRVMSGTEYREGSILISRLKTHDKAIAEHEAPRQGWRVPKVGPAFEGKPYVSEGKAYMTQKIAVPNRVADVLESIYGVPVEFRVKGVNIWKAISVFGSITKRAKLFASLFQHVDFLTRDLIVAFTPEGIRHGVPLKFPSFVMQAMWSVVSPTSRANLQARILSGDPLYTDSDISLLMVADKGWKLGQDELLIRRDVREHLERVVKEGQEEGLTVDTMGQVIQGVTIVTDPITKRLASIARFFESGLFDGMYRISQAFTLEHVFIPKLRRLHPTWTSEQIAGAAAEEINKQFSTLGVWQSVIQQPAVREAARAFFFSWNESESLIRQGTSAFVGKNRRYWQEFTLSTFYTLALVANVINLVSEGEPLPPDRYVPVKFGSPWSSMPWGIAYNDKFLSPRLPWNGRNGQPLYLDIVGQMDTFLRWILDPASALTARVNVFPRAVMNQVQGKDFWGREIKDWKDRLRQLLTDLFMPIGAGNLAEAARQIWPQVGELIPEAEGRIGVTGALIQATGLNVRAENTLDMLDRYARESGLLKADGTPVESWADLEPHQKKEFANNEELQIELGLRSVASVERNYPGALGFAKLDELDRERITRGEALLAELISNLEGEERGERFDIARAFRVEVSRLKKEIADRKSQVDEDFQLFKDTGILPDDPNKRALVEYYNMFEKAVKPSGVMDWEKVDELEQALRDKWSIEQEDYVDRNIGLTDWGPLMQEFIDAQRTLSDSGYYDVEVRDRRVFRYLHPEIEEIISGKFYNQKPIDTEVEKISLKWNDVYRQLEDLKDMGLSDEEIAEQRRTIYNENPGFLEDDRRKDAFEIEFPDNLIDAYVDWYTDPSLEKPEDFEGTYYEDDWYLQEHPEFHDAMLELGIWTESKEERFKNVPTREVFALYQQWQDLPLGTARREFEAANPNLDLWLSIKFGTKLETQLKVKEQVGKVIPTGIKVPIERPPIRTPSQDFSLDEQQLKTLVDDMGFTQKQAEDISNYWNQSGAMWLGERITGLELLEKIKRFTTMELGRLSQEDVVVMMRAGMGPSPRWLMELGFSPVQTEKIMWLFSPEAREQNAEYSYEGGWGDLIGDILKRLKKGAPINAVYEWLQRYLPVGPLLPQPTVPTPPTKETPIV